MQYQEACLHLGFLIEEIKGGLSPEDHLAIGLKIEENIQRGEKLWKVALARPLDGQIAFGVRPVTTPGWGSDFQIMKSDGSGPLEQGRVSFLFNHLSWLLDRLAEFATEQELTWQNETADPEKTQQ